MCMLYMSLVYFLIFNTFLYLLLQRFKKLNVKIVIFGRFYQNTVVLVSVITF